MSEYKAEVRWRKGAMEKFVDDQYSRGHHWVFDGGAVVPASSSPQVVPLPYSVEKNVDPEEAFVGSLASCHMLFFLSIAAKKRLVIESYTDKAVGIMEENEDGAIAMTKVTLFPEVVFLGKKNPSFEQLEKMHHLAHVQCFIANSVKTEICIEIIRTP